MRGDDINCTNNQGVVGNWYNYSSQEYLELYPVTIILVNKLIQTTKNL